MTLRLKLVMEGDRRSTVLSVPGSATLDALRDQAWFELGDVTVAGMDGVTEVQLVGGFPPRPLVHDAMPGSASLADAGVLNGDRIELRAIKAVDGNGGGLTKLTSAEHPSARKRKSRAAGGDGSDSSGGEPGTAVQTDVRRKALAHADDEESADDDDPVYLRRIVPADNSCLFMSVAYLIHRSRDPAQALQLRQIIVDVVSCDAETWSDSVLGRPRASYVEWIGRPNSWGGFIELVVLSKHFGVNFVAVDVKSGQAMATVEPEDDAAGSTSTCFLVFDGTHYDPFVKSTSSSTARETEAADVALFLPAQAAEAKEEALWVAEEARQARQFTDLDGFTLQCKVCGQGVVGQDGAVQHGKNTGHSNFGEVDREAAS